MSVVIRLHRSGRKKVPLYRIVASDSRNKRDGRFLEVLGSFDPVKEKNSVTLNRTKLESWLKRGAVPTQTVRGLIEKSETAAGEKS